MATDDPDDLDRDRRRPRTPPAGVRAQTAAPVEIWEDDTPPLGTRVGGDDATDLVLHKIGRRVKVTAATTQSTLDRVELLRKDVREDIVHVNGKVDALGVHSADLRQKVGQIEGKLDGVILALQEDREQRVLERQQNATMRVTAFTAEVEVDKTRQLSQIEVDRSAALGRIAEQRERARLRRRLVIKILGWAVLGAGTLWNLLSARCH